jgi:site-specific recombinase XerD
MSVIIRTRITKTRATVLYLDINCGGKRKRVDLETTDMREAKRIAAEVERDLLVKGWGKGKGESVRLDDLMRTYLEHSHATKAAKTAATDRDSFTSFIKVVGNIKVGELAPKHFESYRLERLHEVKASSVNVALRHLKAAFNWAVERGIINESPAAKVHLNRVPRNLHPRFLREEEVERLRAALVDDDDLLRVMNFALWTGARRNEIVHLLWSDIDLDRRTITVQNRIGFQTKSGCSRSIPINPALHEMLMSIKSVGKASTDRVFSIGYWSFGKRFLRAVRRAKIEGKVTLHTLPHTFASHLVMQGVDLASIQEILGHHDVSVTMIYSHLSPEHLARTVEKLPY